MRVTFDDKVATKQSSKPRVNCITDDDINELKNVINANTNEYSTDEILIGEWKGKPLYSKIVTIPYSSITFDTEGKANIDLSSLDAEELWVDVTFSGFEADLDAGNIVYKSKFPLNDAIVNKGTSGLNMNYRGYTLLQVVTQTFIQIMVGDDRQTYFSNISPNLCLAVKYTKAS